MMRYLPFLLTLLLAGDCKAGDLRLISAPPQQRYLIQGSTTPVTFVTSMTVTGDILAKSSVTINGSLLVKGAGGITSVSSVTASAFFGDGSQLTGLVSAEENTYTSSKTFTSDVLAMSSVTASAFFGDGSALTGIGPNLQNAWVTIATATLTNATYYNFAGLASSTTYRLTYSQYAINGSNFPFINFNGNYGATAYGYESFGIDGTGAALTYTATTAPRIYLSPTSSTQNAADWAIGQIMVTTPFGHPQYPSLVGVTMMRVGGLRADGNISGNIDSDTIPLSTMQFGCLDLCNAMLILEKYTGTSW